MNERKLCQCPCCKEWFNTTQSVMLKHYKLKHEFITNKTFAIAELIVKRELFLLKAKFVPFPESLTLVMVAASADAQLQMVISQSEKKLEDDSYIVGPCTK